MTSEAAFSTKAVLMILVSVVLPLVLTSLQILFMLHQHKKMMKKIEDKLWPLGKPPVSSNSGTDSDQVKLDFLFKPLRLLIDRVLVPLLLLKPHSERDYSTGSSPPIEWLQQSVAIGVSRYVDDDNNINPIPLLMQAPLREFRRRYLHYYKNLKNSGYGEFKGYPGLCWLQKGCLNLRNDSSINFDIASCIGDAATRWDTNQSAYNLLRELASKDSDRQNFLDSVLEGDQAVREVHRRLHSTNHDGSGNSDDSVRYVDLLVLDRILMAISEAIIPGTSTESTASE